MAVYTGGGVTLVMDPPPVVYVKCFHEGSGPARHLGKKTEAVVVLAKQLAPVRSGALKAGIQRTRNRDEHGRYAFGYKVFTPVFYGYYVHEGTGPSVRQSFPNVMKFAGTKNFAGQVVYTDVVNHPGTPAVPFLQNALVAMAG